MAEEPMGGGRGGGSQPGHGPDPSALTIATVQREIEHLRAEVAVRIDGVVHSYDIKFHAIDKATDKFEQSLTRVPTDVDHQLSALKVLHQETFAGVYARFTEMALLREEKFAAIDHQLVGMSKLKEEQFKSIQVQLAERDIKVSEMALATRTAVDAALAAAEKARMSQAESFAQATAKAEAGFQKQVDQQAALAQTTTGALRDQLEDLKSRVTRIEAIAIGQAGQKTETQSHTGSYISLIGIGLAIISSLIAGFAFFSNLGKP